MRDKKLEKTVQESLQRSIETYLTYDTSLGLENGKFPKDLFNGGNKEIHNMIERHARILSKQLTSNLGSMGLLEKTKKNK